MNIDITRRDFLKATAALVVAFGWPLDSETESATTLRSSGGPLPANQIDSWLIVHNDNTITVMTGKVELGTGVSTSLRQIVADELDFRLKRSGGFRATRRTPSIRHRPSAARRSNAAAVSCARPLPKRRRRFYRSRPRG